MNIENIIGTILYNDGKDIIDLNLIIDKMKIVILDKIELIFPFKAYNDDYYLINSNIKENKFYKHFNTELKFSETILEYFRHSLQYLFNKYNWDIEDSISILLFIRYYTYKYYLEV